jgi:hypothetical protein
VLAIKKLANQAQVASYREVTMNTIAKNLTDYLDSTSKPARILFIATNLQLTSAFRHSMDRDARIRVVAMATNVRQCKKLIANSDFDALLVDASVCESESRDLIAFIRQMRSESQVFMVPAGHKGPSHQRALNEFKVFAQGESSIVMQTIHKLGEYSRLLTAAGAKRMGLFG